jgi:hypothetical protein
MLSDNDMVRFFSGTPSGQAAMKAYLSSVRDTTEAE